MVRTSQGSEHLLTHSTTTRQVPQGTTISAMITYRKRVGYRAHHSLCWGAACERQSGYRWSAQGPNCHTKAPVIHDAWTLARRERPGMLKCSRECWAKSGLSILMFFGTRLVVELGVVRTSKQIFCLMEMEWTRKRRGQELRRQDSSNFVASPGQTNHVKWNMKRMKRMKRERTASNQVIIIYHLLNVRSYISLVSWVCGRWAWRREEFQLLNGRPNFLYSEYSCNTPHIRFCWSVGWCDNVLRAAAIKVALWDCLNLFLPFLCFDCDNIATPCIVMGLTNWSTTCIRKYVRHIYSFGIFCESCRGR